jgi:pimeloyl-ACP methyl ester carboxylesterase
MRARNLVLLHGVGPGPEAFADVAALLSADHRVLCPERPWSAAAPPSLDDQATAVAVAMAVAEMSPATVVGVSGGATLALRLAALAPGAVERLVVHEPLVGHHAPTLATRFKAWAARVEGDDADVLAFVRSVMSESTWSILGQASRARVLQSLDRIRAEVPVFGGFDPSTEELEALQRIPVLTTIGGRSGPERREAATVLATLAGATVVTIADAGNLPHVDAPVAFVDAVRAFVAGEVATC